MLALRAARLALAVRDDGHVAVLFAQRLFQRVGKLLLRSVGWRGCGPGSAREFGYWCLPPLSPNNWLVPPRPRTLPAKYLPLTMAASTWPAAAALPSAATDSTARLATAILNGTVRFTCAISSSMEWWSFSVHTSTIDRGRAIVLRNETRARVNAQWEASVRGVAEKRAAAPLAARFAAPLLAALSDTDA